MTSDPGAAPSNLTKVVIRGAGLASSGHLLTQLLTFVTFFVLARLLTPHTFGVYAAGSIFIGVGLLVSESGLLAALVRRSDHLEEAASTAFVASIVGGLLLSLAALAAAPLLWLFFDSRQIGLVAAAMSGCIALQQPTIVPDALMQRRFSFARRLVLEPGGAVAFAAVAIAGSAMGAGVWALVAGAYAGVLTRLVLAWAMVRWRPKLRLVSFAMWRELAGFGRHVVASEGIQVGYSQSQTALIGRFVGTAALGQFGYALRLAMQPVGVLINGIAYVLLPALARISDDEERFRAAALRSLRAVVLLGFPMSMILLGVGEPLTVLIFGDQWRPAGRATAAMCALSAGTAVIAVGVEIWKASGQPKWLSKTRIFSMVVGLSLLAVALPFGLTAVGASISVAALVSAGYALYGIVRVLALRPSALVPVLLPPLGAAAVMAAAIFGLEALVDADAHSPVIGLLLVAGEVLAGSVLYLLVLSLISRETGREARHALSVLWSTLRRRPRRVASSV